MAVLNKITPQKFKTLVEQVLALNIDTPERLEGVVEIIFEKVFYILRNIHVFIACYWFML